MQRHLYTALGLAWLAAHPAQAGTAASRTFEFVYRAEIVLPADAQGPVHVFVPLPIDSDHQRVHSLDIVAPIPGAIETEPEYGNRYWHGNTTAPLAAPLQLEIRSVVTRDALRRPAPSANGRARANTGEVEAFARYLGPNARVAVNHEILNPILSEVRAASPDADSAGRARSIYDWVVDNVEYKKVGRGWGNGDTFWACNERYGNCTDFHALFISLARSEGIPARFEMGFSVPADRSEGSIEGYHCWVQFHLPESGWFPIDASEASKRPEHRELLYGGLPADRVHFSIGRDLKLGPDHHGAPLNYFIYPYVEVAGEAWDGPVEKSFEYRDVGADAIDRARGG
jgi:transglutaminase-like putative cysteine protease